MTFGLYGIYSQCYNILLKITEMPDTTFLNTINYMRILAILTGIARVWQDSYLLLVLNW